jgi:energy-coupling factor transporter transmembrane protein EcfT
MTENLGKLKSVHGISPVFKQRAFILAIISFVFFTAMVIGFLVRPGFVFVLLGTAFLVVGLFTLFGWFSQRNTEFKLFENGFSYKEFVCAWDEIESINVKAESQLIGGAKINCLVHKTDGQEIVLTEVIEHLESIVKIIGKKTQPEQSN